MNVAANIILRSVPALGAALAHLFSGIPTISTGAQEFPKIKQHLLIGCWHPCPMLQLRDTVALYIPEDVTLKRDGKPQWKHGVLRMKSLMVPVQCSTKKKNCVWDPAHSPLWPPGCQSVLEAKIEIPDTPVANFAHASPALEQDLL